MAQNRGLLVGQRQRLLFSLDALPLVVTEQRPIGCLLSRGHHIIQMRRRVATRTPLALSIDPEDDADSVSSRSKSSKAQRQQSWCGRNFYSYFAGAAVLGIWLYLMVWIFNSQVKADDQMIAALQDGLETRDDAIMNLEDVNSNGGDGGAADEDPEVVRADVESKIARIVEEVPTCRDKEPLLRIILSASDRKFHKRAEKICEMLPTQHEIHAMYGPKPVVYGLETCQAYRDMLRLKNGTLLEPRPRIAGLYHTGTNAVARTFETNWKEVAKFTMWSPYEVPVRCRCLVLNLVAPSWSSRLFFFFCSGESIFRSQSIGWSIGTPAAMWRTRHSCFPLCLFAIPSFGCSQW